MRTSLLAGAFAVAAFFPGASAVAKEIVVKVDSRSAPWSTGANPKLAFGLADARAPTVVWQLKLFANTTLKIMAKGSTTTVTGGGSYGPTGQPDWTADRGAALFPSHYIRSNKPIHLNELVGCFVDADGKIVGKPFAIGAEAEIVVPEGAMALSMGINDDRYSDNTGALTVTIDAPEPDVTVEPSE